MREKSKRKIVSRTPRGLGVGLGMAALFAVAGCQDNLRNTTTGAASNVPSPPAASIVSPSLLGTWLSPSCGERAYARSLTFDADGRFTAEDRVSPCPPGARCVWSGIVLRSGTFSVEGETVRLHAEEPARKGPGMPLPDELTLTEGLVERGVGDGGVPIDCAYSKQAR